MKKTLFILALSALGCATADAQEVMTIHRSDGTSTDIPVQEVKEVTFETRTLNKQYDINGTVCEIGSLLEWRTAGNEDTLTYFVYPETEQTSPTAEAPLTIRVAADCIGKELNLAEAVAARQVAITCPAIGEKADWAGTFQAQKDRLGSTLTLTLNAVSGIQYVAASYRGSFTRGYFSTDTYRFTPSGKEVEEGSIHSVFRIDDPAATYSAFAFGSLEASTPEGLSSGNYAVIFQLPSALIKSGGTIDLAAEADSYQFRFIDFADNKLYENDELTEGSITYFEIGDRVYFKIHVTLRNGVEAEGEYFGTTTAAESFDPIIPQAGVTNGLRIYDADGTTLNYETSFTQLVVEEKNYKGEPGLNLYFLPTGEESTSDQFLVPKIRISQTLINAGEINLSEIAANTMVFQFQDIQLYSPDNEWVNAFTEGTFSIAREGSTYTINLSTPNTYKGPYGEGDGRIIVLNYSGEATTK